MIFLEKTTTTKKTWKYDIFFKCPEKMVFQKNHSGIWPFLYYLERWYFFSRKYDIFSLDRKWKMIFLKKYIKIWYYLYICINLTNMILPFCKKSKMIFSRKNTLKGHWHYRLHCRKSSNNSLYFNGDLHRRLHILLSCEKKLGNLIYRIEIWLLFQFILLNNLQYSVQFSPREMCLDLCLSSN